MELKKLLDEILACESIEGVREVIETSDLYIQTGYQKFELGYKLVEADNYDALMRANAGPWEFETPEDEEAAELAHYGRNE